MNSVLNDLAREREARSNSPKRPRSSIINGNSRSGGGGGGGCSSASAIVDLCDSDDDGISEDPSLALARRLQAEEDLTQHSELLAVQAPDGTCEGFDDEALAERLQREEVARVMGPQVSPSPGSDDWYQVMVAQENKRRIECEGPPPPPGGQRTLTHYSSGAEQRLQGGGRVWSRSSPCVNLDGGGVRRVLRELDQGRPPVSDTAITLEANLHLLKLLCSWRQHVRETIMEERVSASAKWTQCFICTSELTFLGRATAKGGVIGLVANAANNVDNIEKFIALFPRDARKRPGCGLSPFLALLVALYMRWPVGECPNAQRAWLALNSKIKIPAAQAAGLKASPRGIAEALVVKGERVPDQLQHLLLSRAHFP